MLQLEVGKKYKSRSGDIVEIVKSSLCTNSYNPYISSTGRCYTKSGAYLSIRTGHDLVEEVQEAPKQVIDYLKVGDGVCVSRVTRCDRLIHTWAFVTKITDNQVTLKKSPEEPGRAFGSSGVSLAGLFQIKHKLNLSDMSVDVDFDEVRAACKAYQESLEKQGSKREALERIQKAEEELKAAREALND